MAQLRQHEKEFQEKGARLATIGLGDMRYAQLFRKATGITFPLLIDENREAYGAARLQSASIFHLFRLDNMAARKRAKAGGHRQHRLGQNPFQLGGSFVFAPGDRDLFSHVSETFGDNASPADVLSAVVRA